MALRECLESLEKLDFEKDQWEAVISDDGTPGMNKPVAELFSSRISLKFITASNSGPAAARNRGVSAASGQYLVFVDDDCRLDRDFLKEVYPHLQPDSMIGGQTINVLNNIYAETSQLLVDYIYQYFNRKTAVFFTSNNMVVCKDTFIAAGRFNTLFKLAAAEDRAFCFSWIQSGKKMKYIASAKVYHAHSLSFIKFWRQQRNYGRGARQFHQVVRQSGRKIPVEPLVFYTGLFFYPFKKKEYSFFKRMRISFLIFLGQLANTAGYMKKPPATP